jgi:uncharacterized protein
VTKLLVFLLVLAAIFWGRRLLKPSSRQDDGRIGQRRQPVASSERMRSCRRCGVHVPESEGVRRDGDFYCCEAHAQGRDD